MPKRGKRKPRRGRKLKLPDYARFVFRATALGGEDRTSFSIIDLFDNAIVEIDRLKAIREMMTSAGAELNPDVVPGIASLIEDCEQRLEEHLRLAVEAQGGRARAK